MNGSERMEYGWKHEQLVASALSGCGWIVDRCGQGVFSEQIRDALKDRQPPAMLRWWPDLIAARGRDIVFVEAKSGWSDTPNWSLELDSLSALKALDLTWGVPVAVVWADLTWNWVMDLRHVRWFSDPQGVAGSGTPFALFLKAAARPWESFGAYGELAVSA